MVGSVLVLFFSSVAADFALRLGPNNERSGQINCKHFDFETPWFHNSRQINHRKGALQLPMMMMLGKELLSGL